MKSIEMYSETTDVYGAVGFDCSSVQWCDNGWMNGSGWLNGGWNNY